MSTCQHNLSFAIINPLTPGHFAKKCLPKRVKPFLGRCLAEKNPNRPKRCLQVDH